jgi:hypothetical protein
MISTKKQFHLLGENQRQSSPSLTNQTLCVYEHFKLHTSWGLCVFLVFIFGLGQRSNKKMKTQLKVVALSVLVATSTYAQENKDII